VQVAAVPEGDTIWLAAKRLDTALRGSPLIASDLRTPRLATRCLAGRTILEVAPAGKHLLMRFDHGWTLHSHLRMDGSWHLYRPGCAWRGGPTHTIRAILRTSEWTAVGFRVHDLHLIRTRDEHRLIGHLGPDILAGEQVVGEQVVGEQVVGELPANPRGPGPMAGWDPARVLTGLAGQPEREIGSALLDQRILAGVGNIYRCEALFLTGVNPWQRVATVPDLVAVIDQVRALMVRNRGRSSQSTTGADGHDRAHYVHGRNHRPCRRCGTPIRTADQGVPPATRVTYWCPSCQPRLP